MIDTLVFDRSDRLRMRVNGPKAAEMINGLVTNEVAALTSGQGVYAAALTAKSKIVADLRIFREDDSVLIDTSAAAGPGWMGMVRKYINPRVASYSDVSSDIGEIGIYGADAARVAAVVTNISQDVLNELGPYSHIASDWGMIARVPDLGITGFVIFPPASRTEDLKSQLVSAGARYGTTEEWELQRVSAIRPEWGIDMNDETLPQEANMDELGAISYNKGCYIGQETVARIHFRGHVNKHLRKLTLSDSSIERGAELLDADGKVVGEVRSIAGNFAIGMVRREVASGTQLKSADAVVTVT